MLKLLIGGLAKENCGKRLILVRHGQTQANVIGSIVGITDSKLTVKGRQQASSLFPAFFHNRELFPAGHVFSSDLSRCIDTMKLSLSDPPADYFRLDKRLREMNFGKDEGRHFDSLPDEIKQNINSLEYQPEGGETWPQVSDRFLQLVGELSPGNYLVFTHGGLMCTQTWAWGVREVKRNCSAVCLRAEGGKVTGLEWVWEYDKERIG